MNNLVVAAILWGLAGMYAVLPYQTLANAVLIAHVAVVVFVLGGLLFIVGGNLRGWRWVNHRWFRIAHLAAIAIVVVESWAGILCPLTLLESWLRARAGAASYSGGFVEHWLQRLLFYQAPAWIFAATYTAFGLLVAAAWWRFPPETGDPRHQRQDSGD